MMGKYSDYLVIGAGLAGASAVEGIRALDAKGSISIIGAENAIPYDRPPLSKKLWFGKKKVEEIRSMNREIPKQYAAYCVNQPNHLDL